MYTCRMKVVSVKHIFKKVFLYRALLLSFKCRFFHYLLINMFFIFRSCSARTVVYSTFLITRFLDLKRGSEREERVRVD